MHTSSDSLPRHVLVTGAAGLLGRAVVGHLRELGVGVTAMLYHRGEVEVEAERVVVGNMMDAAFVRDAVDGADAVIHCAALKAPMMVRPPRRGSLKRVDGPGRMLRQPSPGDRRGRL